MPGTTYQLEVNPHIPARIGRLSELANNLWYSWDRATRTLFSRLHPELWHAVGHSPKAFLKRVDQLRLTDAAADPVFHVTYNRVLAAYDSYCDAARPDAARHGLADDDLIAYFCAEYGFHESLPIYSGGLGILAGDHCKAASDLALPFVAVGLLYRQGYFSQNIDREGRQHAQYGDSDFDDLPISPVLGKDGQEVVVEVELPGRTIHLKVWQADIGKVRLFLLDTDLEVNSRDDRNIGHRLYGGDRTTRIEQEIVLGIGGVRALHAMGLAPTVWHINEGHAAFLVLERMRQVAETGVPFAAALEAVAANTVFTTHTAVPAGHDHFTQDTMKRYFEDWCARMSLPLADLLALGNVPGEQDFNMTALAIRGSRHQNGVSRIHGVVSSQICAGLWPNIAAEENPVTHVTNGVHLPTFLSDEWQELFERKLGAGWGQRLLEPDFQDGLRAIPDHLFWSVHQSLKAQLLHMVRYRIRQQHFRDQGSEAHLDRTLRWADPNNPNVLTIGFARRFATYKRATLIFQDLNWLRQIISETDRRVLFIFAGKAHPADQPGQEFLRRIAEIGRMPEFESHILLVEGYDLQLARRLVSGVDVWLNNPEFPLEACGTSGMKAAMNGVINLSVLDGWWDEGYDGKNGWAIKPASVSADEAERDRDEARTLYELLQDQIVPLYYATGAAGFSSEWIRMAKESMATIMPQFNAGRMVSEYLDKSYRDAARQGKRHAEEAYSGARTLADWKQRVRQAWEHVQVHRIDEPVRRMPFGSQLRVEVAVQLGGLTPEDVVVEMLLGRPPHSGATRPPRAYRLQNQGRMDDNGAHRYLIELEPERSGKLEYRVRVYPNHELLTHPFEVGMMAWL